MVEGVEIKAKKNFPEIIIQEPTPLVPRKESEVVLDGKEVMEEITESATVVPSTLEEEVGEEATEIVDAVDDNPVKKKKESTRKKSIPILDQEYRMVPVNEATELEIRGINNSEIRREDAAQDSSSSVATSSSAAPSSSPSPSPAPSLQPEMRKESAVSTSSDWSWPTVGGQEAGTQSGQLGVPAQSRRISSLAPAEVDSPLATKVDKFTMIPHPGK